MTSEVIPTEVTVELGQQPSELTIDTIHTFEGTVDLPNPAGVIVAIFDKDDEDADDVLTFGIADAAGAFSASWPVFNSDAAENDTSIEVYASFTDVRNNTITSEQYEIEIIRPEESPVTTNLLESRPHVNIHYNYVTRAVPNVYVIVLQPEFQQYMDDVKIGINRWTEVLQKASGNDNAWNFNILTYNGIPSKQDPAHPMDISIILADYSFSECAHWGTSGGSYSHEPHFPITVRLCGIGNHEYAQYVTMHEFAHALGLGHAYHVPGDMMCSRDPEPDVNPPQWFSTCLLEPIYHNHPDTRGQPSVLDINGMLYAYGFDGFEKPNRDFQFTGLRNQPYYLAGSSLLGGTFTVQGGPWTMSVFDNKIFVTKYQSDEVTVIDGSSNLMSNTISVGDAPYGIAANPETGFLYVTNYASDSVSIIDGNSDDNKVIATLKVGDGPRGVTVDSTNNMVYVANHLGNSISVIDGSTNKITSTIKLKDRPHDVAVNPDKELIYVTTPTSFFGLLSGSKVSVIDENSQRIMTTITVGKGPRGIDIDLKNNFIYVANYDSGTISIIDGASNKVISNSKVGSKPWDVYVSPVSAKAYVSNLGSTTISIINDNSGTNVTSLNVGAAPNGLTINHAVGMLYVAHNVLGTIDSIELKGEKLPEIEEADTSRCEEIPTSSIDILAASGSDRANVPENVIDDDLGTRWSAFGKGSWIILDLGSPDLICSIDIAWYRGDTRANGFSVSASEEGTSYKDIFVGGSTGTTSELERYNVSDTMGRYLKITVNGNTVNDWASITEIKVYGK